MKKIVASATLVLLFFLFTSWFYKIIVLLFFVFLWRKEIKENGKRNHYRIIVMMLLIAMFCVLPRYRYNTQDRVQLIYQDANGHPINPPVSHYLTNVFLPEEEICNIGIWIAKVSPNLMPIKIADWLWAQFEYEKKRGNIRKFRQPYKSLNWNGLFMMSGMTSQIFNMMGYDTTESVYLIRPKKYDKERKYLVVFFMHGYFGNLKIYTGILKDIEECIILCIGTKTWNGIYTRNDIDALFTKQIPFLESIGYKIDRNALHIVGLSNGGSAADVAYNSFSNKFKTITFISSGIHQTYPISCKVLLIGGGKDPSSSSLPDAYHSLMKNRTDVDMFWDDDESHGIFLYKSVEIVDFINKNLVPRFQTEPMHCIHDDLN